jgi:hypothetical protein
MFTDDTDVNVSTAVIANLAIARLIVFTLTVRSARDRVVEKIID